MGKELWEVFCWIVRFLTPPPVNASPERLWRWRVKVAVITMSNSAVTAVFIALALGAAPALFAGFTTQDKVKAVRDEFAAVQGSQQLQLLQVQKNQLDTKILETRTRQCAAIKQRDKGVPGAEPALEFATERIQEELDDFYRLVHQRYRLPDCSEV